VVVWGGVAIALFIVIVIAIAAWILTPGDDGSTERLAELEREVRILRRLPERDRATLESKQDRVEFLGSELNGFRDAFPDSELLDDPRVEQMEVRLERQTTRLIRLVDIQEKFDAAVEIDEAQPGGAIEKELEYNVLVTRLDDFLTIYPDDETGLRMHAEAYRELNRVRDLVDQEGP